MLNVPVIRKQFPSLDQNVAGHPIAYFDGPGGTQVPDRVIDAMGDYLRRTNANRGGAFGTSERSDRILDEAHAKVATLLGASDPNEIVFGANMTTLTFHLARTLARSWRPGDEIVVTHLDHDANVTPWVLAAQSVGATVRYLDIDPSDCTLRVEDFEEVIGPKTRLVAVGLASNAVGTINPVAEIARLVHAQAGLLFVDAVHFVSHGLVDVAKLDCDFLACSAYKFFGPHVGILWGRRGLLEAHSPEKLRPAPSTPPGSWMMGTANHEGIAGTAAAVEYLASLGVVRESDETENGDVELRESLERAMTWIRHTEVALGNRFLEPMGRLPNFRLYGIRDPRRWDERVPTFALRHDTVPARAIAAKLGQQGMCCWHGNFYALPLTERLELEPDGLLRIGLVHYNTPEEVDRLVAALGKIG